MSYGSPTLDPTARAYKAILNHSTIPASGDLVVDLNFGGSDEVDNDQVMQDFCDLIDGSTDFVISSMTKITPSVQAISPT
jgi:hypothetical protein